MTDQHDPQQPDPQQAQAPQAPPPASPYGSPTSDSSDVTQATPVTPPTQETPVSSPYGAPSYQPPGYQPPQSQAPQQPYGQPAAYDQGQQSQPYGQAPQQYAPQQPAYGSSAPDQNAGQQYGQPQQYGQSQPYGQQYGQAASEAQQQYGQPQQYGQSQPYGQPQQYGAPAYGATGYGQSTATKASVSSLARLGAIGAAVASLLAILGSFLNWLTATMNIPLLAQGDIGVTANGVGAVGVTLPNNSAILRQFADDVTSSGGITTGWIVIVLAVVVLVLAVLTILGKLPLPGAIVAVVGGLIILGLAIFKITQISHFIDTDELKNSGVSLTVSYQPGIGLWVTLVAGILMAAAGVLGLLRRN